ncbi:MAG: chemotaxis protein CheW [Bacteroidota bacterium]
MNSSFPLLVVVAVSGLTLALPAAAIGELVHEPALVRSPQMPRAVAGLFSLRGQVVPVLRPDVLLDLPPPAPGLFRVLLVFHDRWALLVERAETVLTSAVAPVTSGHSLGDSVVALLPGGVLPGKQEPVPVLAPDRLLSQAEAQVVADVAERARQRWEDFRSGDA